MTGKQECTFDPKGRLIVPAKYRVELGDQFYITPGLDGCLSVYPAAKWNEMMEKIAAAPRALARKARHMLANTITCEPDKQGRIFIPQELRDLAHLSSRVAFVGQFDYAELWDLDTFQAEEAAGLDPAYLEELYEELQL